MPEVVKMKTQEAQMIVPDSLMDKKATHGRTGWSLAQKHETKSQMLLRRQSTFL